MRKTISLQHEAAFAPVKLMTELFDGASVVTMACLGHPAGSSVLFTSVTGIYNSLERSFMTFGPLFKLWCLLLIGTLILVAACIRWFDVSVALAFLANTNRFNEVGEGLGSAVLVAGEMVIIVTLAIVRMANGNWPDGYFVPASMRVYCMSAT